MHLICESECVSDECIPGHVYTKKIHWFAEKSKPLVLWVNGRGIGLTFSGLGSD